MKSLNFRTLILSLVGISIAISGYGASPADTLNSGGVKSYFLLKLNLDTDPVDLQNYIHAVQFKKQVSAFADDYTSCASALNKTETALLNEMILAALKGDFDQSENSFKTMQNAGQLSDNKKLLIGVYSLMSQMMELKGNFEQAAIYQQQALDKAIALQNPLSMAKAFAQMGRIKWQQEKYPAAEQYLLRMALPAFSRISNKEGMVFCYREIADFYLQQELFPQAKWFYVQSLSEARKLNYRPGMIAALMEIGQLKYDVADFDLALKDWKEAEQLAIPTQDLPVLLKLKYNLARTQKQLGNLNEAEKYARAFEQLKDILLNPTL